jgi:hypothetical protein
MSNFTYALLALAASGILFLRERIVFVEARASTRQLQAQIGALGEQLSRLEQSRSELERRVAEARDQARESGQAEVQTRAVVPPNPNRNGGWPTNEPYFYVPKRDLPGIGLVAYMTNAAVLEPFGSRTIQAPLPWTNRLSDDAVILFGMTPIEREAVDEAYLKLWEAFRHLGLGRVERIAPEPGWSIPVVSEYHVPRLTNEASTVLTELKSIFRPALGTPRADYFVEGAPGASIRHELSLLGQAEYFIVFGPNRSPDGEVQSAISYSRVIGEQFMGGSEPLDRNGYLQWFFKDGSPDPNPVDGSEYHGLGR